MSSRTAAWIDGLALRAARATKASGSAPPAPAPARGEQFTRGSALKAAGIGAALVTLPVAWRSAPAEASPDCYQPCLGIVGEVFRKDIRRCASRPSDFLTGGVVYKNALCVLVRTEELQERRGECGLPRCGKLGHIIQEGGDLGNTQVPPLDLPAGTKGECENCRSVGGYCGVCAGGTVEPEASYFCGTAGVAPCRYCGGC